MPEIRFLEAEKVRAKLTNQQQRQIRKLYKNSLEHVRDWSKQLENKENISSVLRREYLAQMEKDLQDEMKKIGKDTKDIVTSSMRVTSEAVVADANKTLNRLGVNLHTAYSFVPSDVVQSVSTGRIYGGDWTLSKAIWTDSKKTSNDIHQIIAAGVAENKSSYDIAKELEKYVDPAAKKPWDWGKIYPGTKKVIDYNAQRLARTMVSHAYQQSFVRTTIKNPFFEGYRWLNAGDHRVCPICTEYAEDVHAEGLPEGVFLKDELPLDHPNGRCTFSIYTTYDTDQIVDSLLDWAHGEENEELDSFAESLYPDTFHMIKEQVKLATTVDDLDVKNLPEVSIEEASDDWFEYENANLMSQYIRDGAIPDMDINGNTVSVEQQDRLKSEALKIQEAASKTTTEYKTVYRGMVLQPEEAQFARNSIYNIETLTATATSKDIAMIYADVENAGGSGVPVLFEIENPKGIRGFDRDGLEVILPKGSAYRVSQSFYDEDDFLHVRLYAGKNLG